MPYGYHAPYGIFICFLRNTSIFFAFLPLAYQIHFLPYYQKNTPIFLAFFTFFALFIPFLTKKTPFSPPFCPLHPVFTYCHFKTALHSCQLLLQVPKMKPYSSPFFAFSLIFTESANNLQKWNHFSRLFYGFIFTPTLLTSFFMALNLSIHIFWNHILRLFCNYAFLWRKNPNNETIFLAFFCSKSILRT